MRKIFHGLVAATAAAILVAQSVWAATDPSQLVTSVTAQVTDIVKTKSGASREAAIREVLRNSFDLPHMGRLALGPHWNEASEQQRARFLAAFETAEARAYSERLGKLAAYTLTIDKVVARASGVWIVNALLSKASGQLIKLEWEVHDNGQGPRIADVKVAGVSMSQIKRSEFNSYIQNNGGTVEPLVQQLEARAGR